MFAKFKSALYNVVGNFDPTEGGTVSNLGTSVKFPYTRPHFLQLNSDDEILVTADHALRPIICPRDISRLPWNAGYAETINAGKSKRNEDQSAVHVGLLTRCINRAPNPEPAPHPKAKSSNDVKKTQPSSVNGIVQNKEANKSDPLQSYTPEKSDTSDKPDSAAKTLNARDLVNQLNHDSLPNASLPTSSSTTEESQQVVVSLPYYYFGVFDGHAGWGAAVSAANQLPHIIHEKLCDVIELIIPDVNSDKSNLCGPLWSMEKTVSPESAVIGALEQAFWAMDHQIAEERHRHHVTGGCTACVALFILGKVFVSNAGDSRGIIGLDSVPLPMSFDFTPETETQRIRKLGARHPELLGGEFTHLEFLRRPLRSDVGKKAAYRDHYMKGWSLKTITEADLKYPLVCGEGKRSRVLATIGVTRGFGDHDLKAQFSALPIKPFLSPEPEVRVFDLKDAQLTDSDVLVLGTDGLWDIMSNEKAVSVVCNSLQQFSPEESHRYKYRYTSAAHDLVLWSRGRLKEHNWRTSDDRHATIDDISVFVVPLLPYKQEFERWQVASAQSPEVFVSPEEAIPASEVVMMIKPQKQGPTPPIDGHNALAVAQPVNTSPIINPASSDLSGGTPPSQNGSCEALESSFEDAVSPLSPGEASSSSSGVTDAHPTDQSLALSSSSALPDDASSSSPSAEAGSKGSDDDSAGCDSKEEDSAKGISSKGENFQDCDNGTL